jgi:hypothetical protein
LMRHILCNNPPCIFVGAFIGVPNSNALQRLMS